MPSAHVFIDEDGKYFDIDEPGDEPIFMDEIGPYCYLPVQTTTEDGQLATIV